MIIRVLVVFLALCLHDGYLKTASAQHKMESFYECSKPPRFINNIGMQQPVAIDTQQSRLPGVVVKELNGARRVFRHPSWSQSGYVASTVRDAQGNIYAVPLPSLSLDINPMEKRNTIYRIDSASGIMSVFSNLPVSEEVSQSNPFGTLGLAYDCQTQSLYVSSVADSDPQNKRGVIYQIELSSKKILSKISGIDAFGIELFDTGRGKRLYFGDPRSSSVYSLPLESGGGFIKNSKPKHEFSLLAQKNGDSTQVRKIRFVKDKKYGYKMVATDIEFSFRMFAETGRAFRHYEFFWNAEQRNWELLAIEF